jgi:hypothetical protein
VTEAQFLIERPCPNPSCAWTARDLEFLPVCVWVSLAEHDRLPCGGKTYALISDRATGAGGTVVVGSILADGRRRFVTATAPAGHYPCVCEHMGQLIE